MKKDIPKYLTMPVSGINRYGVDVARKCLEIEAKLYRESGRDDAARALKAVASGLKKISKGTAATPVDAFGWPTQPKQTDDQQRMTAAGFVPIVVYVARRDVKPIQTYAKNLRGRSMYRAEKSQ